MEDKILIKEANSRWSWYVGSTEVSKTDVFMKIIFLENLHAINMVLILMLLT